MKKIVSILLAAAICCTLIPSAVITAFSFSLPTGEVTEIGLEEKDFTLFSDDEIWIKYTPENEDTYEFYVLEEVQDLTVGFLDIELYEEYDEPQEGNELDYKYAYNYVKGGYYYYSKFEFKSGKDYYFKIRISGNGEEAVTCSFTFGVRLFDGITADRIESITAEDRIVLEGISGFWADGYYDDENNYHEENWYRYYDNPGKITVTLKNGEVLVSNENAIVDYKGEQYMLSEIKNNQSTDHWQVGNTYTCTGVFSGFSFDYNIKVLSVKSITAEPIILGENSHGFWDGDDYYYYATNLIPTFTVELSDGSIINSDGWLLDIYGNSEYAEIITENDDSFGEYDSYAKWKPGHNEVKAKVFNTEFTFDVEIVSDFTPPIESVTAKPFEIMENSMGRFEERTNYDYDKEEYVTDEFFIYDVAQFNTTFTVKFTDGTTCVTDGWHFNYMGADYQILYNPDSQYEDRYKVGKNIGNFYLYEYDDITFTAEIDIIETEIVSVTAEPIYLYEYKSGWWYTEYDDNGTAILRKYVYATPYPNITVEFNDGNKISGEGGVIEYNGKSYEIKFTNEQYRKDNLWTVGNTYTIDTEICGYEFSYDVTILPKPTENNLTVVVDAPKTAKEDEEFDVTVKLSDFEIKDGIRTISFSVRYDSDALEHIFEYDEYNNPILDVEISDKETWTNYSSVSSGEISINYWNGEGKYIKSADDFVIHLRFKVICELDTNSETGKKIPEETCIFVESGNIYCRNSEDELCLNNNGSYSWIVIGGDKAFTPKTVYFKSDDIIIAGEFPEGTVVSGASIKDGANYSLAESAMKDVSDIKDYKVYDTKSQKDGAQVNPNGKALVIFSLPDGYTNPKVFILTDDGSAEELPAVFDEDNLTVTVEVDELGLFVLANSSSVKGDISGDGILDIIDVAMARAHIVGNKTLSDAQINSGDMNGDNILDIVDVVMMRKAIVG